MIASPSDASGLKSPTSNTSEPIASIWRKTAAIVLFDSATTETSPLSTNGLPERFRDAKVEKTL
jgi:hypothetical protein